MVEQDVEGIVREPMAIEATTLADTHVDAASLDGVILNVVRDEGEGNARPQDGSDGSTDGEEVEPTTHTGVAGNSADVDDAEYSYTSTYEYEDDDGKEEVVIPRELIMSIEEGTGVLGVRVRTTASPPSSPGSPPADLPEDLENEDVVVDTTRRDLILYIEKNQSDEEIDANIVNAIRKYAFYREYIDDIEIVPRGFSDEDIHPSRHPQITNKYRQYIDRGLLGFLQDYGEVKLARDVYAIAYLKSKDRRAKREGDVMYTLKKGGDPKRRRIQLMSFKAYMDLIKRVEIANSEEIVNVKW